MQMVEYLVQFLIVMTCICAKLVSAAHANTLLSHIEYILVFFLFFI